jgi:hypothetical protein
MNPRPLISVDADAPSGVALRAWSIGGATGPNQGVPMNRRDAIT